jgi:uncharacterized protein (TIGR00730 family)
MLYRLLGPLEVRHDGEPLSFSPRQRIVLSMLLVEPNRVVAVDRLVDSVWDATPPSTAKEQIRICVSSIRRKLIAGGLPNTIDTRPPGYSIRCTKENLDLLVFESLVASGRADAVRHRYAEAADAFRRALALWRGRPLAGVNSQIIESIGVGFAERRLAVTEEYVAARLQLGDGQEPARQHDLISELAELVTANPFRERLRAQLMIELHRVGRRAEALETYRSGRQLFVEKLGLEPGHELLRIEQAILRGDNENILGAAPSHAPAPATTAVPHLLPADAGDFVGRADLVERTRHALSGRHTGSRTIRLVAVHGGPWLGKTSLVVHAAHLMSDEFPDGQLFVQLGGDRRTVAPCEVLRRFLGALGVTVVPDSPEERAEMYRNLIADRRMLIVLDDVADEKQVLALLPGNTGCAVVVTSRVKLTNLPGSTFIGVGPMSRPDSVALLTHVLGPDTASTESADLGHLAELCADEPLALRLAAARLAARPHWLVSRLVERMRNDHRRLDELSHGGLDLVATIRQTYDRLGEQAKLLLRRASLLSTAGFTSWVCAPMLDTTEDAADDALAELVNAGLLDVAREPNGQVRFHLRGLLRTFARTRFATEDLRAERTALLSRLFDVETLAPAAVTEENQHHGTGTDLQPVERTVRQDRRQFRVGLLCGATAGARLAYLEFTRELCVRLVQADVVLVHSGIPVGTAAAAVRAAAAAGGHVICVVPHMALRSGTEGARGCEVHVARSTDGCRRLVRRLADGFVVLPGGLNTFEQLGDLVTSWSPADVVKPVVLANQDGFFDPLVAQLDRALAEDFVTAAERSTIKAAVTVAGVLSCFGANIGGTAMSTSVT